jgi:hypothetical protein
VGATKQLTTHDAGADKVVVGRPQYVDQRQKVDKLQHVDQPQKVDKPAPNAQTASQPAQQSHDSAATDQSAH